jgi:hypothetical protein
VSLDLLLWPVRRPANLRQPRCTMMRSAKQGRAGGPCAPAFYLAATKSRHTAGAVFLCFRRPAPSRRPVADLAGPDGSLSRRPVPRLGGSC